MRMLTSCRRTFTGECGVAAVSDDAHAGVTEARTGRQARRAERRARYTHTLYSTASKLMVISLLTAIARRYSNKSTRTYASTTPSDQPTSKIKHKLHRSTSRVTVNRKRTEMYLIFHNLGKTWAKQSATHIKTFL